MASSLVAAIRNATTRAASFFGIRAIVAKQVDEMIAKGVLDANGQIHSLTSVMFKKQMMRMCTNLLVILSAFSTKYFVSLKISILCVSFAYLFVFIRFVISLFSQINYLRVVLESHKDAWGDGIVFNPKTLLYLQIYKEAYDVVIAGFSDLPFYKQWFYRASGGEDLESIARRIAQNSLPKAWECIVLFVTKAAVTLACYTIVARYLILPLTTAYTQLGWFETLLYPFGLAFRTLAGVFD